jgi:hypothetical protein
MEDIIKPTSVPSIKVQRAPAFNLTLGDVIELNEDLQFVTQTQRVLKLGNNSLETFEKINLKKGTFWKVITIANPQSSTNDTIVYELEEVTGWTGTGKGGWLQKLFPKQINILGNNLKHFSKVVNVAEKNNYGQ